MCVVSVSAGSLGCLEKVHTNSRSSLLRLGGIRFRCSRPQQLVDEFYVKRLGMQELVLSSAVGTKIGSVGGLEFCLALPPRQQLHQLLQQLSVRSQQRRSSPSSSRTDLGATGEGEEVGVNSSGKFSLLGREALNPNGATSRRSSFGSWRSARINSLTSALPSSPNRFAAFEFFSPTEVEGAVAEATDATTNPTTANSTFKLHAHECLGECV